MSEKRTSTRWARRLRARFWRKANPAEIFLGFTSNFSNSGVFISTRNPVGPRGRVKIEIGDPPDTVLFEGVVARAQAVPLELRQVLEGGMGVRFLTIEEVVEELRASERSPTQVEAARVAVESSSARETGLSARASQPSASQPGANQPGTSQPSASQPSARTRPSLAADRAAGAAGAFHRTTTPEPPRRSAAADDDATTPATSEPTNERRSTGAASLPVFPVRFSTFDQFQQLYDRDIRIGGLFIATPQPAPADSLVQIRLELPRPKGAHDKVELRARVVRAVPAKDRKPAGMAVEFLDAEAPLARLERYIRGDSR